MKESKLLNYLEFAELYKEHSEALEKDECGYKQQETELMKQLSSMLNEEGQKMLKYYSLAVENKADAAHYCAKYKLLSIALKIGMEIQQSFDENDF